MHDKPCSRAVVAAEAPGMCAGFRAGAGDAHQLANRSGEDVLYLEVGDRDAGDTVSYPGRPAGGHGRGVLALQPQGRHALLTPATCGRPQPRGHA